MRLVDRLRGKSQAAPERPAQQIQRNIAAMAAVEKTALEQRSLSERLSGAIAGFAGTITFVLVHFVWLAAWIFANRWGSPLRFDPYPYNVLILMLAVEAILLSTFVLISQNQLSRVSDRRTRLNLQISLLAESEMTKVLDTLRTIALRLGLPDAAEDEAFRDLSKKTDVEDVVRALEELPPEATELVSPAATE